MSAHATLAIDSRDLIGEAPVWDSAGKRLLWCDNGAGVIHQAQLAGTGGWLEGRRWTLGRPIAAAIPRARGGLVVVGGVDVLLLDEAGRTTPFARIDADPTQVKFNEAKCDRHGRIWAGTRDHDFGVPGRQITPGRCALYRIDPSGVVETMLEGVSLSNGLDWSPDGRVFYFIDTYTRTINAFDFDLDHGTLRNRRTLVMIESGQGLPDGMTVDREGSLWVAIAGAGEIRQYSPDGILLSRTEVATPTVTSCAFGGADGQDLFITSARVTLPAAALRSLTHGFNIERAESDSNPGAGGLFTLRPGPSGAPATPFTG